MSAKPHIVFLDSKTLAPDLDLVRPEAPHDWVTHDRTDKSDVIARLHGADVAITNKVPIRQDAIDALPDLRMISVAAAGYDCVDVAACQARGIVVSVARGYAVDTVPEHVMTCILALRRNLLGYRAAVIDGAWQRADQFCFFDGQIRDLRGATLGLIGAGAIGQGVARLATAFGMRVLVAARKGVDTPPPGRTSFDEVLRQSDVLTLHAPLTPDTRDLIGPAEFARMDRRPVFINASRGGLVNEAALVAALDDGQVSGAALDVLSVEPPRDGNPLLPLAARSNVIVTPHIAWASEDAMNRLWRTCVANIDAFLNGAPTNVVS